MEQIFPGEKKQNRLILCNNCSTWVEYEEEAYLVKYSSSKITIHRDKKNFTEIILKNQQVHYKVNVLGGLVISEKETGSANYKKDFYICWEDEVCDPELKFLRTPRAIKRKYKKGDTIELGIEDVAKYHIVYQDQVEADFLCTRKGMYEFKFSTGFSGSVKKDSNGSHSIIFKGIPVDAEDDHRSESKFIVSRSRYTNNLLLILQDNATVFIELKKHS